MKSVAPDLLYDYSSFYSVQYNPSGSRAAMICARGNRAKDAYSTDLWLAENGSARRLTWAGDVSFYIWEDDSTVLFAADRTEEQKKRRKEGEPFTAFYRLSVLGGEAEPAFEVPFTASSVRKISANRWLLCGGMDLRHPDLYRQSLKNRKKTAEEIREGSGVDVLDEDPWSANGVGMISGKRSSLYLFDSGRTKTELLTDPETDVSYFDTDGKWVFFSGEKFRGRRTWKEALWRVRIDCGESAELAETSAGTPHVRPAELLVSPDEELSFRLVKLAGGKLIAAAADKKRYGVNENPKFFCYDFEAKQLKLIADPDISIGHEVLTDVSYNEMNNVHADGNILYFLTTVRNHIELRGIAPDGTMTTLIDREGSIGDFDIRRGKVILSALYGMLPEEIYTWDREKGFRQVTRVNEKLLRGTYVAQPEKFTVQSCGWDIDGWVLYPKDFDPEKKYPAILDIHGGPKCAYGEVYFHEMQVWASAGYIVLFCNPYGGDGRGNRFAYMADRYGTTDYQNIMDFTDLIVREIPAVDAGKLCVTGGSYGGFMTNWIVTHTSQFAAAATQRSISNWVSMYGISDIGPVFAEDQNGAKFFGDGGVEKMWEHSPLRYVKAVTTPTLVLHSSEDHRCPVSEGYQFYTAMKENGVDTRMVVFHGENHELSRSGKPSLRVRRLKEIQDWFEEHISKS